MPSLNELINDEGVYRTAPATLDLLIIFTQVLVILGYFVSYKV